MQINEIAFFTVILLANIIHGITGFAGTLLAMPFGIQLVGYAIAKPVLNVHAIISGVYVLAGSHKKVNWKEVLKIVIIMTVGILAGIFIKSLFVGKEKLLYAALGIFIVGMAVHGLAKQLITEAKAKRASSEALAKKENEQKQSSKLVILLLPLAGIVHGIFVSGGPLLTSYLTKKIDDKMSFRATISTVWIFLNTLIFVDDFRNGYWDLSLLKIWLVSLPFLLLGMFIGGKLVKKMSQSLFMKITYILLIISGISLLVK